jgi:LPXTG-site transpeptidase (sortase) family protein
VKSRQTRLWALVGMVLGLLLVVGGFFERASQHSATPATTTATPTPLFDTSVIPAPSNPVIPPEGLRIRVVDLGIDLPIVAGDGWDAPFYKAATYPGLGLPGSGVRSVIYAHARAGMFGPLFNGKVGERVEIDRPDGASLQYAITEFYRSWPATDVRWLQPLAQEQLVLVTCTTYNPNDPRIVAIASPI